MKFLLHYCSPIYKVSLTSLVTSPTRFMVEIEMARVRVFEIRLKLGLSEFVDRRRRLVTSPTTVVRWLGFKSLRLG
jgi:hypothetical protein